MSFQNKSFWMAGDATCHNDGEMGYEVPSKTEPKRSHQWFMETSEPEVFCNKKQAIEAVNGRPLSGNQNMNFLLWENNSSFQPVSGQFTDHRLFGEPLLNCNLAGRSISSAGTVANQTIFLNNTSTKRDNSISLGPPCDNGPGPTYRKPDLDFNSMGPHHTFNKGDSNFTLMGHDYNKGFNSILSMGQSYNRGDENCILVDQRYEKGDENDNIFSAGPAYNKGVENFISMGITYNKANGSFIPMVHSSENRSDNSSPVGPTPTYDKVDPSVVPEAYDASGGMISSYDLLMGQSSNEQQQNESVEGNSDPNVSAVLASTSKKTGSVSKKKEPKTLSPNSFPSNVKSLLSTGIFDGVPVKYVSWSREKQLRGIIKGSSYLCSCQDCNISKALNAYDFERHAGCKTKHPNNHIYFENGKTVYAVVQELKSAPQEVLFDAIQTVTGSPIDQKKFNVWKASYLAASRELQRIYGKDGGIMPS